MGYERYLEENYPKWQQKLQDKRLSEQPKVLSVVLICFNLIYILDALGARIFNLICKPVYSVPSNKSHSNNPLKTDKIGEHCFKRIILLWIHHKVLRLSFQNVLYFLCRSR